MNSTATTEPPALDETRAAIAAALRDEALWVEHHGPACHAACDVVIALRLRTRADEIERSTA